MCDFSRKTGGIGLSMNTIDCNAIMLVAQKIFMATRSQSSEIFQDVVLEEVKAIIPFDHCKWGIGFIQNEKVVIHSLHLHNFPDHNKSEYVKHQPQDPILATMVANRDRVFTYDRYDITPRESFIKLPIYQEYCRKYGLEQLISTMVPDPISNLFSVISLSRKDYARPFSDKEKRIKTLITPILTEARRHNIFIHMIQMENKYGQFAAICDVKGVLKEAEPEFSELLREEWPQWQGPMLNFIPEALLNGQPTALYKGEQIDIRISARHDHVLLQIERKSALERLTSAEKKVVMLLLQGLPDKKIATTLGISPKTVGHHLQHVYRKIGVPNRARLIATLKSQS